MKKIFISPPAEDEENEAKIICEISEVLGEDVEIVNSCEAIYMADPISSEEPINNVSVWDLSKDFEWLSMADVAYFAYDWKDCKESRLHRRCAEEFDIQILEGKKKEKSLDQLAKDKREKFVQKINTREKEEAEGTERIASILMDNLEKKLRNPKDMEDCWIDVDGMFHVTAVASKIRDYENFPCAWHQKDNGKLLMNILGQKLVEKGVHGYVAYADVAWSNVAKAEFVFKD